MASPYSHTSPLLTIRFSSISPFIAFFFSIFCSVSAQTSDTLTLRTYQPDLGFFTFSDPTVDLEAARYVVGVPVALKRLQVYLGGPDDNGSARIRVIPNPEGLPVPLAPKVAVFAGTLRKTKKGVEKISLEFPTDRGPFAGTDFFIVIDSLSTGTKLLSDRVVTAPICDFSTESHRRQLMRKVDGHWVSGEFSYAMIVDAVITLTAQENRFRRAEDRYHLPARVGSGPSIAASDVNADSRVDLFISGGLFVNRENEMFEEVALGDYTANSYDSAEVYGYFLEIDGNDYPDILRISRPGIVESDSGDPSAEPSGYLIETFINQSGTYPRGDSLTHFSARRLDAVVIGDPDGNGLPDALLAGTDHNDRPIFMFLTCTPRGIHPSGDHPLIRELEKSCPGDVGGGQFVDIDLDGDPDLALTLSGNVGPLILLNAGEQRWDAVYNLGERNPRGSSGCDWGDYDGDGDLDLLHPSTMHPFEWEAGSSDVSGVLANQSVSSPGDTISRIALAYGRTHSGGTWLDVDNDGDLDAFIAVEQGCASGMIFSFNLDSTARDVTAEFGMAWNRLGPDVLTVDLDGNGFVDLVGFEDGAPAIYLNQPVENRPVTDRSGTSIEIRNESGRTLAYGRVEVHVGDRIIVRNLAATHGRFIGNAPFVSFTTSDHVPPDSIVVRYTDGTWESFSDITTGGRNVLAKGTGSRVSRLDHAIDELAAVPNPFSREVTLYFTIAQPSSVRLEIFSTSGDIVRTINPVGSLSGRSSVKWNGTNDAGDVLPSGHYFYRITTEDASAQGRVVLTR